MIMRFTLLVLVGVLATGCPLIQPPQNFTYTSADTLAGGRAGDLPPVFDGVAAGAENDQHDGESAAPRDVVEPDVIRRQGNLLYLLNQHRGLSIVNLDTEQVLAEVPTYGYPRDLYFDGANAYVLVAQATDYTVEGTTVGYTIGSRLVVVDVTSPANPEIRSEFSLPGELVDSRLVGDILYAVTAEYQWIWYDEVLVKQQADASWVTSVDLSEAEEPTLADQLSFDGAGTVIHASQNALFVATPQWQHGGTAISYIDIADPSGGLTLRGSIGIDGAVADRFKLDAWEGVLRVVSSGWTGTGRRVWVTTIDLANPDALELLASMELDDAFNETLFATRFDGPRAYIVTYLVVDPLFVLDLSDPSQPVLLGALEVPGWSTHIEPRGDRLVTLGVDDTDGRRISVSVYDVSGAPQRLDIVTFGEDWAWSSAYDDVKAFAMLDTAIVVPFSGWNEDFGGYDRLQFITLQNDDLALRGTVDLQGQGVRSFEYNDALYGLTHEELAVIDAGNLDDPLVTNRIVLAEDVIDRVEVAPGRWAEIVRKNNSGETLVRTRNADDHVLGETMFDSGYVAEIHAYSDGVVLAGTRLFNGIISRGPLDAEGAGMGYVIARIRCPEDAAPSVDYITDVEVDPYYGFYWWPLPYAGGAEIAEPALDMAVWGPAWYPFTTDQRSFVLHDTLALRCYASDYTTIVGDAVPAEGLALVHLEDGAWTSTLGLGVGFIVSMHQAGERLVVGTKEELAGSNLMPECAFYVQTLAPATASLGDRANVPGTVVQYDPQSEVLVLRDQQWSGLSHLAISLRTVQWNGGTTAIPIDETALPQSTYRVVGQGNHFFVEGYDGAYAIYPFAMSGGGALTSLDPIAVGPQWASLVDARNHRAFVAIGGSAVAAYAVTGDIAILEQLTPVMGYPSRIRFNPSEAIALLGYAGWAPL